MKLSNILAAAVLCGVAGSVSAAELIVTAQSAKGGQAIGLDFVSDGKATAFQARIAVPGADQRNTNLSKCSAGLPKSHTATCTVPKAGEILVLVDSATNAVMPAGLVSVGQIGVRASLAKGGAISVTELLVSDPSGNALEAKSRVEK